jgi:hypothetical protein
VVAVQVTYKNVTDFVKPDFVPDKLNLGSFSAINQEAFVVGG